jgi:hypothetical protein
MWADMFANTAANIIYQIQMQDIAFFKLIHTHNRVCMLHVACLGRAFDIDLEIFLLYS